jgi:hypothetical protein
MSVNHKCYAGWGDQVSCRCEPAIENPYHPDYRRLNKAAAAVNRAGAKKG